MERRKISSLISVQRPLGSSSVKHTMPNTVQTKIASLVLFLDIHGTEPLVPCIRNQQHPSIGSALRQTQHENFMNLSFRSQLSGLWWDWRKSRMHQDGKFRLSARLVFLHLWFIFHPKMETVGLKIWFLRWCLFLIYRWVRIKALVIILVLACIMVPTCVFIWNCGAEGKVFQFIHRWWYFHISVKECRNPKSCIKRERLLFLLLCDLHNLHRVSTIHEDVNLGWVLIWQHRWSRP